MELVLTHPLLTLQIVADGVKTEDMFRAVSGSVRVEKGNEKVAVGEGAVLNSLGSGHTFGEMSFLDGSLPCANCIAEGDGVEVRCRPLLRQRPGGAARAAVRSAAPDARNRAGFARTAIGGGLVPGSQLARWALRSRVRTLRSRCCGRTCAQVLKLSKQGLEALLEKDVELRCAFYKQMAINVTQRLQKVSKTTADIREAPRGLAQQNNPASELSAKKLLKIRRRLGIPDAEQMACMTQCVMISPAKRKSHGTLYVFETAVGFVAKVFGLRQQEVIPYSSVSEVLRETFTLKKEEGAIEMVLGGGSKARHWATHGPLPRPRPARGHAKAQARHDHGATTHGWPPPTDRDSFRSPAGVPVLPAAGRGNFRRY